MGERITVVGLGYVGLPLALLAAKKGYEVTGIDLDEKKIAYINAGTDPIHDEYVTSRLKPELIQATDSFAGAAEASIIILCVPTPVKNDFQPDLGPLKGASRSVAEHMKPGVTVIIESTVNPGVSDEIIVPLLQETSGLTAGKDFSVSHCPERINPGDTTWTVENIPRVVGSYDEKGLQTTVDFYETIIDADIKPMGSLKEAEAVKVVENTFRDINIAFVNELAMSFSALGINVVNVIDGAATKPFAFMPHYPGAGVGGHCIPVDPYYLIEYAKDNGFRHEFLMLARNINNHMPEFAIERLVEALNEARMPVRGTKIALLGLSYKPNVADNRQSPAYEIRRSLEAKGAELTVFDPYFLQESNVDNFDEAIMGQDALFVATAHNEFINPDPEKLKQNGVKVILDGRNCLDETQIGKAGIIYRGIGI